MLINYQQGKEWKWRFVWLPRRRSRTNTAHNDQINDLMIGSDNLMAFRDEGRT